MSAERHDDHMARWKAVTAVGFALGLVGIVGKAAVPVGIIAAIVGYFTTPVVLYVGIAGAVFGLAVWWVAAYVLAKREGVTTGHMMWAIWRVPTWSFISDLADAF